MARRMLLAVLLLLAPAYAEPPRVLSMTPDHGDAGVDPALTQIRFEFDQDMATTAASICGGGPNFPKVTARPRWESPRILVLGVQLEPEHDYDLSLNCPAAQNTRGTKGEPAEITPLSFRTGAAGAAPPVTLTRDANEKAVEALRRAIDTRYSYRDLRVKDWDAAFAGAKESLLSATSRAAFARTGVRLLAPARDMHMALAVGQARFGTLRGSVWGNVDAALLRQAVPEYRILDRCVTSGRFDDGIAYIGISSWPGDAAALAAAHAALDQARGAPGLILDVRANGGGDEIAARRFASRFVKASAVYSRNRYRDEQGAWGQVLDRVIEPAAEGRYEGPVVVLMGNGCVSSCESFLLMMRHGAHATLIGEPSYGSSGNPKPIDLGNGVTAIVPSWEDQEPNGTVLEGRGVQPDVLAGLGADPARDGVLEAALSTLRAKRTP